MPVTRNDKAVSVTPLRADVVTPAKAEPEKGPVAKAGAVPFSFQDDEETVPEMAISATAGGSALTTPALEGIDLAGKKKVIFFVGRGKTGKTTLIRWLTETALASGSQLLMADLDPTNDTFSKYIDGVARPIEASDPILSLKWLDRLLQHAMQAHVSVAIDLGGGDTTLRRLVQQLPDLVEMFEAAGFGVVVFYTVGPQEEDLSPLATMTALNFRPTATAIVLNEGLVEVGESRETAFSRILRHSVIKTAITHGAVPIWMPRLIPAGQVEIRRLHFGQAAAGESGQGRTPLGPFDRARVSVWLNAMKANFGGVLTWLP